MKYKQGDIVSFRTEFGCFDFLEDKELFIVLNYTKNYKKKLFVQVYALKSNYINSIAENWIELLS